MAEIKWIENVDRVNCVIYNLDNMTQKLCCTASCNMSLMEHNNKIRHIQYSAVLLGEQSIFLYN